MIQAWRDLRNYRRQKRNLLFRATVEPQTHFIMSPPEESPLRLTLTNESNDLMEVLVVRR
jgi:hypothetical protein